MTRLQHESQLSRKHAVDPELYHDFHVGEAVMADGFPGRVTEVQDGPSPTKGEGRSAWLISHRTNPSRYQNDDSRKVTRAPDHADGGRVTPPQAG